jgi:uncharacterized protein YdhG (YjbR/CyaY superfamily)
VPLEAMKKPQELDISKIASQPINSTPLKPDFPSLNDAVSYQPDLPALSTALSYTPDFPQLNDAVFYKPDLPALSTALSYTPDFPKLNEAQTFIDVSTLPSKQQPLKKTKEYNPDIPMVFQSMESEKEIPFGIGIESIKPEESNISLNPISKTSFKLLPPSPLEEGSMYEPIRQERIQKNSGELIKKLETKQNELMAQKEEIKPWFPNLNDAVSYKSTAIQENLDFIKPVPFNEISTQISPKESPIMTSRIRQRERGVPRVSPNSWDYQLTRYNAMSNDKDLTLKDVQGKYGKLKNFKLAIDSMA